jgi:hypothetical protein
MSLEHLILERCTLLAVNPRDLEGLFTPLHEAVDHLIPDGRARQHKVKRIG